MLTGQFRELSDKIGSGIPVKIYKLDNNNTSTIVEVEYFSTSEEIPYPWAQDKWSEYFTGYSTSRSEMVPPGPITSPTILYCFYDADVTITYRLKIPKSKEVSVQYGVGQLPQLRDISQPGQLLSGVSFDKLSLCLADGTAIDKMAKPLEDSTVELVICNNPKDYTVDGYYPIGSGRFLCQLKDGGIPVLDNTCTTEPIPIQPVPMSAPRATSLAVVNSITSVAGANTPWTLSTFQKSYEAVPVSSRVTAKGYIYNGMDSAVHVILYEFSDYIAKAAFSIGMQSSSVPTTFPSAPTSSPSGPVPWTPIDGGETYKGVQVGGFALQGAKYTAYTMVADLVAAPAQVRHSVGVRNIIMSRAPVLTNGSTSTTTLDAWLRTNVSSSDQDVAVWWKDNYSTVFFQ